MIHMNQRKDWRQRKRMNLIDLLTIGSNPIMFVGMTGFIVGILVWYFTSEKQYE